MLHPRASLNHPVVLLNQWRLKSAKTQHFNIVRSFLFLSLLSYSMFRPFHSTIIRLKKHEYTNGKVCYGRGLSFTKCFWKRPLLPRRAPSIHLLVFSTWLWSNVIAVFFRKVSKWMHGAQKSCLSGVKLLMHASSFWYFVFGWVEFQMCNYFRV